MTTICIAFTLLGVIHNIEMIFFTFVKFDIFSFIISLNTIFIFQYLSLFFFETSVILMLIYLLLSHTFKGRLLLISCLFYFCLFFLCFSEWVNSIVWYLSSLTLFPIIPTLLFSSWSKIFLLLLLYFSAL